MTWRQEERGKLNCKLENLPGTAKGIVRRAFLMSQTVNEEKRCVNASMDITFCFCQGFFFETEVLKTRHQFEKMKVKMSFYRCHSMSF